MSDSTFIKFPTQVAPDRVTQRLVRLDELFLGSTGAALQVGSRGRGFWTRTYEFNDISLDERRVVENFLAAAEGAVGVFRVTDAADYGVYGTGSAWADVFGRRGDFTDVVSNDTIVNSYFGFNQTQMKKSTPGDRVRFEWRSSFGSALNLRYSGDGSIGRVNSLQVGAAYAHRVKNFNGPSQRSVSLAVGSSTGAYYVSRMPQGRCNSSGVITAPFVAHVSTVFAGVVDWNFNQRPGDWFELSDYRLSRCALVCNSENLLLSSNALSSDWGFTNTNAQSGWGEADPVFAVDSAAWKVFGTALTNTTHFFTQTYTKATTEDVYTLSLYAQADEIDKLRLRLDDGTATNRVEADFDLGAGSVVSYDAFGSFTRPVGRVFDVESGWYKCCVTGLVNSGPSLRSFVYLLSNSYETQYTNDGSDGLLVSHASLRAHPFAGHYCQTTTQNIVGSAWQVGNKLYLEGFDPDELVFADNSRMEVVTRFYDVNSSYHERSEFKRLRRDLRSHREGWAVVEFAPPLRHSPVPQRSDRGADHLGETVHNPVIFEQPELQARLADGTIQITDKPLQMTDVSFTVVEDTVG